MLKKLFPGDDERRPTENIWGWKFSLFGLAVIVILLGIMIYRHLSMGVPFIPEKDNTEESIQDTLKIND